MGPDCSPTRNHAAAPVASNAAAWATVRVRILASGTQAEARMSPKKNANVGPRCSSISVVISPLMLRIAATMPIPMGASTSQWNAATPARNARGRPRARSTNGARLSERSAAMNRS